jgi:C1A family cysteine protease
MKIGKLFNWFKKPEQQTIKLGLGWKRDLPDPRDFKFKIGAPKAVPEKVDLRPLCPPIYNQGTLGSCTANAMGAVFQFEQMRQQRSNFTPSRLFVYYNTRVIEGTVNSDAGATMRNTMKTMVDKGVCPESMWKYNTCKFKTKPSNECYVEGEKNQVLEYLRVTHSIQEIKECLAEGHPVAFGMMLFHSFMSDDTARSGYVVMPQANEGNIGGHAVVAVGYDETKKHLIMRNSWGTEWGDRGYFYLPYEYITTANLAADFWTIRLVE